MASTAEQVIDLTRSLLNDDMSVRYPDHTLISKLKLAQNTLFNLLMKADDQITFLQSAVLEIPANSTDGVVTDLSGISGYPTNMVVPVALYERKNGGVDTDFEEVLQYDRLPYVKKGQKILGWAWKVNKLYVIPATEARELQIDYRGTPTTVVHLQSDTLVEGALNYFAYETAYLTLTAPSGAGVPQDPRAAEYKSRALEERSTLLKLFGKTRQFRSYRRRGWGSPSLRTDS